MRVLITSAVISRVAALCVACLAIFPAAAGAVEPTIVLAVDASHAPQHIFIIRETIAVDPGPLTLVYPKWIPGYHAPAGPISDVVAVQIAANGSAIAWRRDAIDFNAIHVDVPPGIRRLDVGFQLLAAPPSTGELETVSTPNVAVVQWSSLVLYRNDRLPADTTVQASVRLPHDWRYATALSTSSVDGDTVRFASVDLRTLVDSPLNAGRYFRRIPLASDAELDIAADTRAGLDATPKVIAGMTQLVREGPALYGNKHYRDYHFLLTLSDATGGEGIEHHQSSDDRAATMYVADADAFRTFADLMPHEYSHSWNGKYRRPADLYVSDYQAPERTDLLWVYEGLNQYLGEVLTARSGLISQADERDNIAIEASNMAYESGRGWRSIGDTAVEAPLLYETPEFYGGLRRSANDFYTEGVLIWLDVDTIIRERSHGAKSIDDFAHLWAAGSSGEPAVKTYDRADVIAMLNEVVPYDWDAFFRARVDRVDAVPLAGIERAGWRLVYTSTPNDLMKAADANDKSIDLTPSLGIAVSTGDRDGRVEDVRPDSPAFAAGIAPGMTLVAIDGQAWSPEVVNRALRSAQASHRPIDVIVRTGEFYRTLSIAYDGGPRYPHLARVAGRPDVLAKIFAPHE